MTTESNSCVTMICKLWPLCPLGDFGGSEKRGDDVFVETFPAVYYLLGHQGEEEEEEEEEEVGA